MGLDQYLEKKTYVKNWNYMKPKDLHQISVKRGGKARKDIKPKRISSVVEEIHYWRKVNSIHKWFVDNCGSGRDECQLMYVEKSKLEELLALVTQVLSEKKPELLPAQGGFFFGSTDYDEWYWDNLKETKKVLEKELKSGGTGDYYYQASW